MRTKKKSEIKPCNGLLPHLVGIGDDICERCGMNIKTGNIPLVCPYKQPAKRFQGREIMRTLIIAVALVIGIVMTAEPALANCTQQTIFTPDGRTIFCTQCCYNGHCTTTCL